MQVIQVSGHAEQTINKSRFIAVAEHCVTERDVALCLRKLASAHPGAHHLAYAFRIKTTHGIVQRFSDAGEPSGTAGKPILQFLDGGRWWCLLGWPGRRSGDERGCGQRIAETFTKVTLNDEQVLAGRKTSDGDWRERHGVGPGLSGRSIVLPRWRDFPEPKLRARGRGRGL